LSKVQNLSARVCVCLRPLLPQPARSRRHVQATTPARLPTFSFSRRSNRQQPPRQSISTNPARQSNVAQSIRRCNSRQRTTYSLRLSALSPPLPPSAPRQTRRWSRPDIPPVVPIADQAKRLLRLRFGHAPLDESRSRSG